MWQRLYTYDDRGNRIEKVTKYTDESPEQRTVYAYDEAGRGRQQTGYTGGSLSFQETYDEAGHRIKSVEGGTTTLYSYNDKGETVAEEAYAQDGTLMRKEVTRWEHDHMGNPIKYVRSRRVTKFGESYFEPSFGEYFIITYYGKEEK